MIRIYTTALWEVISHFNQLQFFVYLWIAIMVVAWWKNELNVRRVGIATTYVGITLFLLVVAMYYRLIVISNHYTVSGITAAVATYVFISFAGAMWTALAINKLASRQRGWLFAEVTRGIRWVANFLEEKVDLIDLLRRAADTMEQKAVDSDPLYRMQQTLSTVIQEGES